MQHSKIRLKGEELWLLPEKAIYWPRRKTLLVADLHIGKCAAFRQAGIPISLESTAYDLTTLSGILSSIKVERLIILGDFLHSSAGQLESITQLLEEWRQRHQALKIILIRGNHDQHAGDPATALNIECVDESLLEPPFLFTHDVILAENLYTLAGHVHPVIRLSGNGGDKLRLPCFYLAKDYGLLPSFGYFTGGYAINDKIPGADIYAIADKSVIKIY